jgi:NarL family two-component system sensor histidine kinase LiaS
VLRPGTGEVVGVAFFRSRPVFDPRDSLRTVILPVAAILGGVTLFAGLLGGGIGFFTARRLTGRLSAVALAADAWAAGDLAASAPESPPDELGLLAARLNRMARDLTDLIALRQSVATLEERNRLARDLHDTVKQQVFAAAMQVGAARALVGRDPDAAAARLAEAERMAHDVQKELSHVIREMRPVASGASAAAADGEGAPLTARLRAFTEEWSRRTGVAGEFLAGDVPALSPRVAEGLYRVAQEALANVARHSGAATGRVFLSGSRAERTVTLSVTDDGRGFDALEAEAARHTRRDGGGFGLTTMRERAEELPGGAFALTSAPDAGTRIEVRCGVGETGGVS